MFLDKLPGDDHRALVLLVSLQYTYANRAYSGKAGNNIATK